ncbi:MAG: helix-turn-helix domain-containing protein [Nannocystaceae bacterium]|nr:AraC family transcriptional regulator [Myxococcales bacterium]
MYFPDDDPHHELQALGFRRLAPSAALRDVITCCWGARSVLPTPRVENLYPDGGWGLTFCFHRAPGRPRGARTDASVCGVATRRREMVLSGAFDLFGVRFHPGAASRWLGVSATELRDQVISLSDLRPRLGDLEDQLAAARSTTERAALFERWLRQTIEPPRRGLLEGARALVQRRSGLIRVHELAAELGTSERTLERVFRSRVGVSPKRLARLVRIGGVRRRLKLMIDDSSLAELALGAGYCDQAHFTRDFHRVVGMSPGRYRRRAARRRDDALAEASAPPDASEQETLARRVLERAARRQATSGAS